MKRTIIAVLFSAIVVASAMAIFAEDVAVFSIGNKIYWDGTVREEPAKTPMLGVSVEGEEFILLIFEFVPEGNEKLGYVEATAKRGGSSILYTSFFESLKEHEDYFFIVVKDDEYARIRFCLLVKYYRNVLTNVKEDPLAEWTKCR